MSETPRYSPSRRSRFRAPDPSRPHRPAEVPEPAEPEAENVPAAVQEPPTALPEGAPTATELEVPEVWTSGPETMDAVPGVDGPEPFTDPPATPPQGANDDLPRAFQLRNVYEGRAPVRRSLLAIYVSMGGFGLLALGALGGYVFGTMHPAVHAPVAVDPGSQPGKFSAATGLNTQVQAEVDAAFSATKEHRYLDAQKQFSTLHDTHPEWPSMVIESARAALYQLDAPATTQILSALTRNGPNPDASFLTALLQLTHKEFDAASQSFAVAVALDPARPDFYYFWGECLRGQGKPREAAQKFQEALIRNQYETSEDLYQLKLWLSLIQADQEEASGLNAKIDAGLAVTPRPTYSAVFAAAAREIKAGRFKEAATFMAQGRQLTEPVVFSVIIQDPTFVQESWRPELAGFYK